MKATTLEEKYELLHQWLTQKGKTVDESKLRRQVRCIDNWQKAGCIGAIQAVTGFGKTWVILCAIYLIKLALPKFTFGVVVPSEKLYEDWLRHIKEFNFDNVNVHVINSYTKKEYWDNTWEYNVLVVDEAHRCLGQESQYFNKVLQITKRNALLLVSATLDEKELFFLRQLNIPVVDTITMFEARRMNYISDYVTYNIGIDFEVDEERETYEKLEKQHNTNYAKFNIFPTPDSNYKLAMACASPNYKITTIEGVSRTAKQWQEYVANEMGWSGTNDLDDIWHPKNVARSAMIWNRAMTERKQMLYKYIGKIKKAVEIIEYLDLPTITFAENIDVPIELNRRLGHNSRMYYSSMEAEERVIPIESAPYKTLKGAEAFVAKNGGTIVPTDDDKYIVVYNKFIKVGGKNLKREILKDFELKKFKYLLTAKALDEGFNVEGIRAAIIISGSSKPRQQIQRSGRALRFVPGKTAILVNIYIKDTQDETWLKKRQKGETNIRWITEVSQIEKE